MSSSVHGFLSELFGSPEQSDCTIQFTCRNLVEIKPDPEGAEPRAKRQRTGQTANDEEPVAHAVQQVAAEVSVGDSLPAHLIVIGGGSPLFRAQAAILKQQQQQRTPPVIRVSVRSLEEVSFARAAIRFMYTGKLGVEGIEALLGVRRFASELQIAGCVPACDAAIAALIDGSAPTPKGAHPLAGVEGLYRHRALLPSSLESRETLQELLHACRQAFLQRSVRKALKRTGHDSGSSSLDAPITAGGPALGEVLAWAFLDAPSLLSDAAMRQQLVSLPPRALEALLRSDAFATDDEASVLLVLATWLHGQTTEPAEETCERLCRLIRASQLSDSYLHVVLPEIPWFPLSPEEHRFLCAYAHADATKREYMCKSASEGSGFDTACAWYAAGPRASVGARAVTRYEWRIGKQDVAGTLAGKGGGEVACRAAIGGCKGNETVVSRGFEWRPEVSHVKGSGAAGVYLWCELPKALGVTKPAESLLDVVCPGPLKIKVYRWDGAGAAEGGEGVADSAAAGTSAGGAAASGNTGGSAAGGSGGDAGGAAAAGSAANGRTGAAGAGDGRQVAWSTTFADKYVRISYGMGDDTALQLVSPAAAAAGQQPQQPPPEPMSPALGSPQQQQPRTGKERAPTGLSKSDRLAAWRPYLREGRLYGTMEWTYGAGAQ